MTNDVGNPIPIGSEFLKRRTAGTAAGEQLLARRDSFYSDGLRGWRSAEAEKDEAEEPRPEQ